MSGSVEFPSLAFVPPVKILHFASDFLCVSKLASSWVQHLIGWEYALVFYYLEALSFKLFEDGNFLFLKYSMTAKILGSELLLNT